VSANIYVGHYEARVSPIADTNPATTGPNLDNVSRFAPDDRSRLRTGQRGYDFVANAPGYGLVRFRLDDIDPGDTRQVTIRFETNHASLHQGAAAAGDGTRHNELIDDTEGTNWESVGPPSPGQRVVVDLAGGAQTFRHVNVSANLAVGDFVGTPQQPNPTQNRFSALRAFELYACTAGSDAANPTCAGTSEAGWRRILRSQDDAFPSINPRPRVPEFILRSWRTPRTTATHVMFVVVDNQCTGQTSYHGEQDQDPANMTDCRVGSPPLPPRNNAVRAAELEVFSDTARVDGADDEDGDDDD
jgi:extracellular elastinolytic metalloproteinase